MIASLRRLILDYWQPLLLLIGAVAVLFWLSFFRLQTLVPGLSSQEVSSIAQGQTLHAILSSPINAPYKLFQYFLIHDHHQSILYVRLFGVVVGGLSALFFFLTLCMRYSKYVASVGTGLFVTSSWYLHVTRLATPEVLLFGIIGLIWAFLISYRTSHDKLAILILAIACGILLYVPGMIWFMLAAAIWQRRFLGKLVDNLPIIVRFFALVLVAAVISPIIWSISHSPSKALSILAIPTKFSSPTEYIHRFLDIPLNLFVRGPLDPSAWLGRLPILDIFSTVMLLLGLFCYWQQRKLEFPRLIVGSIIIGVILITVGGGVTISVIVPLVYFIISAGIAELLRQWLSVFPKNPLARGVGVGILTLAILITGYYQIQRYFVAWPDNPATKPLFQEPLD